MQSGPLGMKEMTVGRLGGSVELSLWRGWCCEGGVSAGEGECECLSLGLALGASGRRSLSLLVLRVKMRGDPRETGRERIRPCMLGAQPVDTPHILCCVLDTVIRRNRHPSHQDLVTLPEQEVREQNEQGDVWGRIEGPGERSASMTVPMQF